VAAGHSVDVDRWQREYQELMGRIAPRFARVEPRRHAQAMVLGLLSVRLGALSGFAAFRGRSMRCSGVMCLGAAMVVSKVL
jgi:hypothetical protein